MKKSIQVRDRVTISKVKLTNFEEDLGLDNQMCGVELGYTKEVLDEDGGFQFAKEYPTAKLRNFLAHDDLVKKFDALRCHLALICEYDNMHNYSDNQLDEVDTENMFVTQVVLTGHDENAGVVLTGYRLLAGGSKLNLVTPNIRFEALDYKFTHELSEAVDELTGEALLCLTHRKRKIVQAEIFDNEEATDDEFEMHSDLLGDVKSGKVKVTIGAAQ